MGTPKTLDLVQFDPDLPPGALSFDHVLFIDFDGVFHPEGARTSDEFQFVDGFCTVLRTLDPDGLIPIVVSSMWRFSESIEQLRAHFSSDVGRQIVGVTPDLAAPHPSSAFNAFNAWGSGTLAPVRGMRQREVEYWMREHSPAGAWLAIDDRANLFDVNCQSLFLVGAEFGDVCEFGEFGDVGGMSGYPQGGLDEGQRKKLAERMARFLGIAVPSKIRALP